MRPGARVVAGVLLVPVLGCGLAGCGASGDISLPTVSIPTTIPTFTLPTITESTPPVTTPVTPPATRTEQTGTVTVTRTERPTTSTVTSTVTAAPQPSPTAASGVPPWVWIVLAVLLIALIALIVWLVRRARARAAWDQRMAVARRNALWVEDALVQQVMARASTAEAAGTWQAAQPRLLTLDESLYSLSTTAPDPQRAGQATQLRSRLAALVDAMGADTTTGANATVDDLRARRSAVWRARTDLRGWLDAQNARR